jgi:hypothetical protein
LPEAQPGFFLCAVVSLAGLARTASAQTVSPGSTTNFGSQAVHSTSAPQTINFSIGSGTTVGSIAVLTTGVAGKDFARAAGSTCMAGAYGSTTNCVMNVTFTPLAPGLRLGAVMFYDGSGNVLADTPIYGLGTGPLVDFLSATQSSLGSEFNSPFGVAADAAGKIYVADTFNSAVKEILAAGGYTTISTLGGGFNSPESVAVDGAGNVFVADYQNNAVVEIPATALAKTQRPFPAHAQCVSA